MNWKHGMYTIEIGYKCNQKCPFCYINYDKLDKCGKLAAELSPTLIKDTMEDIIRRMRPGMTFHYQFTGGEPCLYPAQMNAAFTCYYHSPVGVTLGINTNLTAGYLDELIYAYKIRPFSLNVNPYHFTASMEGIDYLVSKGFNRESIMINLLVTHSNERIAVDMCDSILRRGIKNIQLTNPVGMGARTKSDFYNEISDECTSLAFKYRAYIVGNRTCTPTCKEGYWESARCLDKDSFIMKIKSDWIVEGCSYGCCNPFIGTIDMGLDYLLEQRSKYLEYVNQNRPLEKCYICNEWGKTCFGGCETPVK